MGDRQRPHHRRRLRLPGWLADDAEIEDATGSTYILADVDEGKAIKVRVSFTDDGGHRETLTSAATAAVTQPNAPATGLPPR